MHHNIGNILLMKHCQCFGNLDKRYEVSFLFIKKKQQPEIGLGYGGLETGGNMV